MEKTTAEKSADVHVMNEGCCFFMRFINGMVFLWKSNFWTNIL